MVKTMEAQKDDLTYVAYSTAGGQDCPGGPVVVQGGEVGLHMVAGRALAPAVSARSILEHADCLPRLQARK